MNPSSGRRNALGDVDGLRVGHHHRLDEQWATGTSVVLTPEGAATAVDVRGAGPGTRETDVLDPAHLVHQAHAVVLTGGSAYGLSAADGAMLWLAERGYGVSVGEAPSHVVPIVPTASIFDLPMSDWGHRPDGTFGYTACDFSRIDTMQGNVGAGAGAVSGNIKGGVGTASVVLRSGVTVAALMVVNSAGSGVDPETGLPWGLPFAIDGEFGLRAPEPGEVAAANDMTRPGRSGPISRPLNTTIGVVATDLGMGKAECKRVAVAGHDGIARAVRPAHAMFDGDTVFAVSTGAWGELPAAGTGEWAVGLDEVCTGAADVVTRAIVHALLAAESVGGVPSYRDRFPSAVE